MTKNGKKGNDAVVRLRLSPAQINVLKPGISLLVKSHQDHQRFGTSPLTYPFRIYPPPRGFDRGIYNQAFMDKILGLCEALKTKSKSGLRLTVDAWQLRAAMFAIRAYPDYLRALGRKQRQEENALKARLFLDDRLIALPKEKSHRVIRSLERQLKRANRALIKAVGKKQYTKLTVAWKAHLRWMRLHIVYCKPWVKPLSGRRARYQRDLDELMDIAKRGLREEGYEPPQDRALRSIVRLYARYARQGHTGMWTIGFLHEDKERFLRKYYLAQFVIKRSRLKELSKS
jgi:hypothetical protein